MNAPAPGAADRLAVLKATAEALAAEGSDGAVYFSELVEVGLIGSSTRAYWRQLMDNSTFFPGRGTYRETAYLEGKAAGKATSVLRVLDLRQVPLTEDDRARITACTDLAVLDQWVDLAVTLTDVADLWAAAVSSDGGPRS
ncbi:hypothetical protein [Streptomyces sp. NPDC048442]|uniref:hypothetical protein n=1 Tax=Streptomyces sp. NPDC048442 TaxID=3154823 RepID=UPI00343E8851